MKEHIFNMKDPIIVGMEVIEGTLRIGTPLCIPAMGGMEIGRVTSIEQVLVLRLINIIVDIPVRTLHTRVRR